MGKKTALILCLANVLAFNCGVLRAEATDATSADIIKTDIATISVVHQHDSVRPGAESALAIEFELKEDWHLYASEKTAPGQMNLKIKPSAETGINFADVLFPPSHSYFDQSSGTQLDVFSGKFTVFLPFSIEQLQPVSEGVDIDVKVEVEGAMCSGFQCRAPDIGILSTKIRIANSAAMSNPAFALPVVVVPDEDAKELRSFEGQGYSVLFALALALLAGLSLNIMPCVWPVLPIIVMRIVEQAKHSKGRSVALGGAFCFGIILFFAALAVVNIILQVFYGTVLQWGDQFRDPNFVAGMAVLLVVMALFMFGVFTIGVPSAISSKAGTGKGIAGAVGMGFLAAILSTPCGFGILAVAFAWAQGQHWLLATLAILTIGVGMAVPYAILTSMPGMLKRLPKPGGWMERFKQTLGFILLIIAVKFVTALPKGRVAGILYFVVALAFCVWMWGGWVSFNTKRSHKWVIRIIAVALAVGAGWVFLSPAQKLIEWQDYNGSLVETAIAEEKPVLIKFTANWCLSCQVVEKQVFGREDIADLINEKGVLAIMADTTVKDYPATLALKNIYKEPAVPVTILFVPGQEPVRWRGIFFGDELEEALQGLASK